MMEGISFPAAGRHTMRKRCACGMKELLGSWFVCISHGRGLIHLLLIVAVVAVVVHFVRGNRVRA